MNRVCYSLALLVPVAFVLAGTPARGDSPIAPLNGTVSFSSASALSDRLRVDSGEKTIKATSAKKLQGSPNSRITVITTRGSGIVHVADVTLREGVSQYHVRGRYVGKRGKRATWDADYEDLDPRLTFEINADGVNDNSIPLGDWGDIATVTVLGGSSPPDYTVILSSVYGPGEVGFSSSSVSVPGGGGSANVDLYGIKPGVAHLLAYCGDVTAAEDVTVVTIDKMQRSLTDGDYQDFDGTIKLLKSTELYLKAIPNPMGAAWPIGRPDWGSNYANGFGERKRPADC